jgi:HAD superfamily hydrolase (TIGR01450 family)
MRRKLLVGAAIDLDGVIFRGKDVLEGAKEAVERLYEAKVPFLFLTNGGGVLERSKASEIGSRLDLSFELKEHHVVLSHSPMNDWLEEYKRKKVLILGFNQYQSVAKSYGFERCVTPSQLVRANPDRFAFTNYGIGSCHEKVLTNSSDAGDEEPFDAIIQLTDCVDWLMER